MSLTLKCAECDTDITGAYEDGKHVMRELVEQALTEKAGMRIGMRMYIAVDDIRDALGSVSDGSSLLGAVWHRTPEADDLLARFQEETQRLVKQHEKDAQQWSELADALISNGVALHRALDYLVEALRHVDVEGDAGAIEDYDNSLAEAREAIDVVAPAFKEQHRG